MNGMPLSLGECKSYFVSYCYISLIVVRLSLIEKYEKRETMDGKRDCPRVLPCQRHTFPYRHPERERRISCLRQKQRGLIAFDL